MSIIEEQRAALDQRGLCQISDLISKSDCLLARDLISSLARDHGLLTTEGWQRTDNRFQLDKLFRKNLRALSASDRFPNFLKPDLLDCAENLIGDSVTVLPPGQQILFTLPGKKPWSIPHDAWHVDTPRLGSLGPPGLQLFICLDDVVPQGGGTLVVSGSHNLLNGKQKLRSREIKTALRREDYFSRLFSPSVDTQTASDNRRGRVGEIDLELIELSGKAGTAYLMDLRLLHTPAPNASDAARIMLTCRLPRSAIVSQILKPTE